MSMQTEFLEMNNHNLCLLGEFIRSVDNDFPISLSCKTNLDDLVDKFLRYGVVCAVKMNQKLIAAACGYVNNNETREAYISVVATIGEYRGRGIGEMCVRKFLDEAKNKGMSSALLYTHNTNFAAIKLYKKIGFEEIESDRQGDIKLKICLEEVMQ